MPFLPAMNSEQRTKVKQVNVSNTKAHYTAPNGGEKYLYGIHTKEDFMELMMANRPSPEKLRYNGSKERGPMTNDQVTELAKKYDPTNMTHKQYRDFLDDLVAMGRISEMEKEIMDYYGGAIPIGYVDEDGDYITTSHSYVCNADLSREELDFLYNSHGDIQLGFDGDLQKSLQTTNKCTYPKSFGHSDADTARASAKAERLLEERRQVMTTVVENIMKRRGELGLTSGKAEASEQTEEPGLMERATEPGGAFWLDLRNTIIDNAREKQKQAAKDAELELLDLILESMTGDEDSRREAAAKLRVRTLMDIAAIVDKYDLKALGAVTGGSHTETGGSNTYLKMRVINDMYPSGKWLTFTPEQEDILRDIMHRIRQAEDSETIPSSV